MYFAAFCFYPEKRRLEVEWKLTEPISPAGAISALIQQERDLGEYVKIFLDGYFYTPDGKPGSAVFASRLGSHRDSRTDRGPTIPHSHMTTLLSNNRTIVTVAIPGATNMPLPHAGSPGAAGWRSHEEEEYDSSDEFTPFRSPSICRLRRRLREADSAAVGQVWQLATGVQRNLQPW